MDLNRVLRAKLAKGYEVTERRRRQFLAGKVKELDADEWQTVIEMDTLMADEG